MAKKVYAVAAGYKTGLFDAWDGADGARAQVDGFRGARYRSFPTVEAALQWLSEQPNAPTPVVTSRPVVQASLPLTPVQPTPSVAAERNAPEALTAAAQNAAAVPTAATAGSPASTAVKEVPADAPQIAVHLYSEAAGPLGPGAYAALVLHGEREVVFSGAHDETTANRQHLRGLAAALTFLKCPCHVTVYTASGYAAERVGERLTYWQRHYWNTESGDPVQHADLWMRLAALLDQHRVTFASADSALANRLRELAQAAIAVTPHIQDFAQPPWQAAAPE